MISTEQPHTGPIGFDGNGLIPAVIQESDSNAVLMIGFMNAEALQATRETGRVHFWSRSRGKLWRKGETSGHEQIVDEVRVNCEQNSVLIRVTQLGAVCHDGYRTCFYRRLTDDDRLETVMDRSFDPASVYGTRSPDRLGDLTRQQFGAYSFLRNHDLSDVSRTSTHLRSAEDTVSTRLRDELLELAGTLDGSHRHAGFANDVLLESGQVVYWATLIGIRGGVTWEELRADRALATRVDDMTAPISAKLLRAEAAGWSDASDAASTSLASRLHATLGLVGQALAVAGQPPEAVIERDLAELRSRDYLAEYFAEGAAGSP